MSSYSCPVCGSGDTRCENDSQLLDDPFGGTIAVSLAKFTCLTCGATGDFADGNEDAIDEANQILKDKAVERILGGFSAKGYSFSSIERLLGLPQRTLTKWKGKSIAPHAAGVTLLKYVHTFPWLLKVAENRFDPALSQRILIEAGVASLLDNVRKETEKQAAIGHDKPNDARTYFMRIPSVIIPQRAKNPPKEGTEGIKTQLEWKVVV